MIKLVLLDLDDTLLHSDKTISSRTIEVLEKCKLKGMLIGFSTARGESNILPYIKAVKPDVVISSSGALAKYKNDIIYSCLMSEKETRKIIDTAFKLTDNQCEITIDTFDKHYWNYKAFDPNTLDDWGDTVYTDYKKFNQPSLKICVELKKSKTAQQISECIENCNMVRFTGSNWYKFSKQNATKGKAIIALSDKLNIQFSEIIAFGDDYGDIEMLKLCGTGIAMGNAIPEVKKISDEITVSNDEDGVAIYLEKMFLMYSKNQNNFI